MSIIIKSKHPLRPPADPLAAKLFWDWACKRRSKNYQNLWAQYQANPPTDLTAETVWHFQAQQLRLPRLIDPAWGETRFMRFVAKTGGAAEWAEALWLSPERLPPYSKPRSAEWGAKGAELNKDGKTEIAKVEWQFFEEDLRWYEMFRSPKLQKAWRCEVEKMSSPDREREMHKLDWPEYAKRVRFNLARWLEEHALMDMKGRTDWPVKTALKEMERVLDRVKKMRALVGLKDTGFKRSPKRRAGGKTLTIAEDLRMWDLAKEIERRDGAFPSWAKLAREAYPKETSAEKMRLTRNQLAKLYNQPPGVQRLFAAVGDAKRGDRLGLHDWAKEAKRAYERAERDIEAAMPSDK